MKERVITTPSGWRWVGCLSASDVLFVPTTSAGSFDQRLLVRLRTTLGVSRSVLASETVLSSPAVSS